MLLVPSHHRSSRQKGKRRRGGALGLIALRRGKCSFPRITQIWALEAAHGWRWNFFLEENRVSVCLLPNSIFYWSSERSPNILAQFDVPRRKQTMNPVDWIFGVNSNFSKLHRASRADHLFLIPPSEWAHMGTFWASFRDFSSTRKDKRDSLRSTTACIYTRLRRSLCVRYQDKPTTCLPVLPFDLSSNHVQLHINQLGRDNLGTLSVSIV